MFPGQRGFALLAPRRTFEARGTASCVRYRFVADRPQLVDKRDMPRLPREMFEVTP